MARTEDVAMPQPPPPRNREMRRRRPRLRRCGRGVGTAAAAAATVPIPLLVLPFSPPCRRPFRPPPFAADDRRNNRIDVDLIFGSAGGPPPPVPPPSRPMLGLGVGVGVGRGDRDDPPGRHVALLARSRLLPPAPHPPPAPRHQRRGGISSDRRRRRAAAPSTEDDDGTPWAGRGGGVDVGDRRRRMGNDVGDGDHEGGDDAANAEGDAGDAGAANGYGARRERGGVISTEGVVFAGEIISESLDAGGGAGTDGGFAKVVADEIVDVIDTIVDGEEGPKGEFGHNEEDVSSSSSSSSRSRTSAPADHPRPHPPRGPPPRPPGTGGGGAHWPPGAASVSHSRSPPPRVVVKEGGDVPSRSGSGLSGSLAGTGTGGASRSVGGGGDNRDVVADQRHNGGILPPDGGGNDDNHQRPGVVPPDEATMMQQQWPGGEEGEHAASTSSESNGAEAAGREEEKEKVGPPPPWAWWRRRMIESASSSPSFFLRSIFNPRRVSGGTRRGDTAGIAADHGRNEGVASADDDGDNGGAPSPPPSMRDAVRPPDTSNDAGGSDVPSPSGPRSGSSAGTGGTSRSAGGGGDDPDRRDGIPPDEAAMRRRRVGWEEYAASASVESAEVEAGQDEKGGPPWSWWPSGRMIGSSSSPSFFLRSVFPRWGGGRTRRDAVGIADRRNASAAFGYDDGGPSPRDVQSRSREGKGEMGLPSSLSSSLIASSSASFSSTSASSVRDGGGGAAPQSKRVTDVDVDDAVDGNGGRNRGGDGGGTTGDYGRFLDPRSHGGGGGGGGGSENVIVGSSPSDESTSTSTSDDGRKTRGTTAAGGNNRRRRRHRGGGRGSGGSSVATISSPSPFSGYGNSNAAAAAAEGGEEEEEGKRRGRTRRAIDGGGAATRPATTGGGGGDAETSGGGGGGNAEGARARPRPTPGTAAAAAVGTAAAAAVGPAAAATGPAEAGASDEDARGGAANVGAGIGGGGRESPAGKNTTHTPSASRKGVAAVIEREECDDATRGSSTSDANVTAVAAANATGTVNATSAGHEKKEKKKRQPYTFDNYIGIPTVDYLEHLSRGLTSPPSSSSRRSPPPPPTPTSPPPKLARYDGRPLDPNATITVADLESILARNGYLRRTDDDGDTSSSKSPPSRSGRDWDGGKSTVVRVGKGGDRKRVAFPQDSVLTKNEIITSATFVSTLLGFVVSQTVSPNLWLVGSIAGGYYGNAVANRARYERRLKGDRLGSVKRVVEEDVIDEETGEVIVVSVTANPASGLVLNLAEKLAVFCLSAYDVVNRIWFMYKTGQLSYEYYKQYENLDQRFKIQDKLDAWNARFQEGKLNFDKWEQENEVGRKVLAGMRTFWLLEEKSYKKVRARGRKSRYRIVQYANDTLSFLKRFLEALWQLVTGRGSTELEELNQGVRDQMSNLNFEILGQQIGSGLAALVVVNLSGAIFLVAPSFMATVGFAMGFIWPTWISGAYRRITATVRDTAARGRRRKMMMRGGASNKSDRFHYFVREDGTKRWYRTGRPLFGPAAPKSTKLEAKRVEQKQLPFLGNMFGNQAEKKTDEQPRQFPSLSNVFVNQAEAKEDTRRHLPFFGRIFGNRGETKKSG